MFAWVLAAAFAAITFALPHRGDFRDRLLRGLILFGVVLLVITELLSAFGLLSRLPLLACWMAVALAGIVLGRWRAPALPFKFSPALRDPIWILCSASIALILTLTAVTATFSPPNSADAMAYHLPRVVYWAEQASIRFFPTPYLNQIMLQPLTEYFMLHTYVLSSGDQLVNFVQWLASLGSIIGVSSIAGLFGAGRRGQAIAALFCATLPSGILASSGAKNDYFLALWLVAAVYFATRLAQSQNWSDALALGAALGLAVLTKATAYLFAPWLLAAVLIRAGWQAECLPHHRSQTVDTPWWRRRFRLRIGPPNAFFRKFLAAGACALLLNLPHYVRNVQLSGSPLGFDSAHGDGFFRWRNETFGFRQTASNFLRNLSEQLGGRSDRWNREVYATVVKAHQWIGIDINDPATTWRWSTFEQPRNANHEANANSRWHLLILALATLVAAWRAVRRKDWTPALYALGLLCASLAFCAYLKWQPYLARLLLPLLVAGSPIVGVAVGRGVVLEAVLCLFLLSTARHPVLQNWTRPLRGTDSIFRVPRDQRYFADMVQWGNRATYEATLPVLSQSDCGTIGFDITNLPLEYPLMALLRERQPRVRFVHTGVENVSRQYRAPADAPPCVVVCFDCAGDGRREALYAAFPRKIAVNKFLIFEQAPRE
jgi:hypothetical protein